MSDAATPGTDPLDSAEVEPPDEIATRPDGPPDDGDADGVASGEANPS